LKPHRDRVVIATKFGRVLDENRGGARAGYVRSATEASLRRLQTDRIDLMQLHIPDPSTPIEETLTVLADLMKEGKVREIGCSNVGADQLRAWTLAARRAGLPAFASTQAEYSLLHRRPVADLLAACEEMGVKLLPFRPLFNGLLSGRYHPGAPAPATSRIGAKSADAQAKILTPGNLAAMAALTRWAEARGRSLLELAFAWLLDHPAVPSIIAGVSSSTQVRGNAQAAQWRLTPAEREEVDQLLASVEACADKVDIRLPPATAN
jgi:aryl-alcohol dehydrogenase-like predicted oxidoreductase